MKKSPLITIFLVVFVDLLGFGIIIPILPYYAKLYGASATDLAWLMVCYSGLQFIFSPFWGALSDRWGRRPIMLISILGISASLVIVGGAPSLQWLFIGRLLAGFFGANIATASAYIADITPPEQRAKGMGMIGAAFGLGFLFGPAIGGFLSQWGYGTAAYVAAGLAGFNFFLALAVLKEPKVDEAIRYEHRPHFQKNAWVNILTQRKTALPIFTFFIVTLGFAQIETIFAFFLLEKFNLQADKAGYILALMAIIMVIIQGGAIGRLSQRFGEKNLVVVGGIIMAAGLFGASLSQVISIFIIAICIQALGYAITNPSLMSLTSRSTKNHLQGKTLGVHQSAGSLARVMGPLTAGLLYDHLGIQFPFWGASIMFALAAILMLTQYNSPWD
jgi:MFS transporter, DHA1 family, tetracycline resistance protein